MIIKERIQKADGTIKYRNYLKQDKLGKGTSIMKLRWFRIVLSGPKNVRQKTVRFEDSSQETTHQVQSQAESTSIRKFRCSPKSKSTGAPNIKTSAISKGLSKTMTTSTCCFSYAREG